jgi:putative chitinase
MPHLNEKSALLLKTAIDSGITSPAELANIMGNAAVETGHFSTMHENFGYRSVDRLVSQVQSSIRRFSREEIQTAIDSRDPQQIATVMYEGRSNPRDLGNTEPGDGWRFHGRGYFQYTGRNNYTEYSQKFGVDLVNNPDLAADPEMAAQLAIAYWKDKVPEHMRNDPLATGKKINGGPNGAEGRAIASRQWANKITPELVENIRSGRITLEQLVETTAQSRSGDSVRSIQKNLTTLGYAGIQGRALVPDGNYGPNTRHAVESFQRQHGLTADGIAGKETLNAIQHRVSALNPLRELELPGFDQALPGLPPELQARISQRAGGESERDIPRQATPVPQPSHYTAPMPSRTASPPAGPVRLPPMPPVEQLQPGTQGAAVFVLQEHLRMLNARDAEGRELKADRDYGPRTVQAVENFQLWAGLETTGSADRATLEALKGHAQYALEQREKGIPVSNHPADNLRPSVADIAVAVDQRPPPVRQTEQPAPPTLDQAPQIATLQSGLIQLGYHHRVSQPLQVNGQFDNATQQA